MKNTIIVLVVGISLTIIGKLIGLDDYNDYTIGGLIASILISVVSYAAILGLFSVIFAWIRKDIKKYWLPCFAWLFLIAGTVDCVAQSYIAYASQKIMNISLEDSKQQDATCFSTQEIVGDLLTGYMAGLGQQAINCDNLMKTNRYSQLSMDITKTHKQQLFEYARGFKSYCLKYGINHYDCLKQKMHHVFNQLKAQKLSQQDCRVYYEQLKNKKSDWKYVINDVIAMYALMSDRYNKCQD